MPPLELEEHHHSPQFRNLNSSNRVCAADTTLCVGSDSAQDCSCCYDPCEDISCKENGGTCFREEQANMVCTNSSNQCRNKDSDEPCYCCRRDNDPCEDTGCNAETGGECFLEVQANMDCNISPNLCKNMDGQQCYCCSNETTKTTTTKTTTEEPVIECEDNGCGQLWKGQGQCVNISSVPWSAIRAGYDLTKTKLWYHQRCQSPLQDENCCLCLAKRVETCEDKGCIGRGGYCVDMLKANLKSPNIFPRNVLDLDRPIEGDLCGRNFQNWSWLETDCCKCYELKKMID